MVRHLTERVDNLLSSFIIQYSAVATPGLYVGQYPGEHPLLNSTLIISPF